jgi:phage N-6-adenine-methyltransferase
LANDLWETPQYIFDWLDREFHFELDAACNNENCKCAYGYSQDMGYNALNCDWSSCTVWLNPPYSNPFPWVKKAHEEALKGCTVVCLLPADTSTKWFHEWVFAKAEVRFVQGRIKFDGVKKGSPKFGSMVVVYGPDIISKTIGVQRPDDPRKQRKVAL